MMWL